MSDTPDPEVPEHDDPDQPAPDEGDDEDATVTRYYRPA